MEAEIDIRKGLISYLRSVRNLHVGRNEYDHARVASEEMERQQALLAEAQSAATSDTRASA